MRFEEDMRDKELVLDCKLELDSGQKDCTNLWSHVPTELGICSAFNGPSLEKIFKAGPFWNMFSELFK